MINNKYGSNKSVSNKFIDPRFQTDFQSRIRSENFPDQKKVMQTQILPSYVLESWCIPNTQTGRPNKGFVFSVDDYPQSRPIRMCNGLWPEYVYRTCDNE